MTYWQKEVCGKTGEQKQPAAFLQEIGHYAFEKENSMVSSLKVSLSNDIEQYPEL